LRKELTAEINSKVPIWVFTWALALALAAIGGILFYLANQVNTLRDDRISPLERNLTVLETKFTIIQSK
jgi:hypothetical protein